MRCNRVATALLFLLLLAPNNAQAVQAQGRLGFGWVNQYLGPLQLDPAVSNHLLQEYALSLSDQPFNSGLFGYGVDASYSNRYINHSAGENWFDGLGYGASINVADNWYLPMRFSASRQTTDTTSNLGNTEAIGVSVSNQISAGMRLQHQALPRVDFTVSRSDNETTDSFSQTRSQEQFVGEIRTAQTSRSLSYDIVGRTVSSRGSEWGTTFSSDYLRLYQASELTEDYRFAANGNLFRRVADHGDGDAPNLLATNAGLVLYAQHSENLGAQYRYGYGHQETSLVDPAAGRGVTSHQMNGLLTYDLSENLLVNGGLGVRNGHYVSVEGEQQAWGEDLQLGGQLQEQFETWTGGISMLGRVGATQPEEGAQGMVYGFDGTLHGATATLPFATLNAGLIGSYAEDRSAIWARQRTFGGTLGARSTGLRTTVARMVFKLDHRQSDHEFMGTSRTTNASLVLDARYRRLLTGEIRGRYQDGTHPNLKDPSAPGELPAEYNVRAREIGAAVAVTPWSTLSVQLLGQYVELDMYGEQQERALAELRLTYNIGKLQLMVWERRSRDVQEDGKVVSNVLWVSVARAFSGAYP